MTIYKSNRFNYIFLIYLFITFQLSANVIDNTLIGLDAPPMSLKRLVGPGFIQSKEILKDHNMVMVFFSSKNIESLKMVSDLHQIKAGINSTNIQYYLINVFEDKSFLESFVNKNVYTIPVLMDQYGVAHKMYNSDIVPLTIVINKDGKISYYNEGRSDYELLNLITHIRTIQ
tara:strand:+ start:461 stop:979 length:519 start_codon:yes stop_codon:yes gene_type:complete